MTTDIKVLFEAGAHFGYPRARRHPTAAPYLYGTKDSTDIFDLDFSNQEVLEFLCEFIEEINGK